ncbi:MAG TPA: T9SS type A sorting domain-containing protein, partial [Cytophagales bacterium]|nr:T9SS type A sorting domain-containing protein [Cytophagales bacterium]
YMIAANLTNATVDYANNITGTNPPPTQGYDHSGTKEGGVLLMNLTPSTKGNTLYNRKFENLCTGKQIFFEAYATVFTADPGVSIRTEIEDLNSGVVIKDSIKVNPVASGPAGTTGWKRISGSLTLTGSSPSLNFRIINNNPTNNTSGNDLALDDIKIKVCAPPSLDAYFDTVALSKTASACDLSKLDLFAKPSSLLRGYYGNNQLFLYQWTKTPEVLDSWKNIGTPIPGTSVLDVGTVASDTALTKSNPRGPIYFRIIAATSAVYGPKNNFQGSVANAANPNDPCSNYTVSDVIKLDISCVLPVSWVNFHGEKTTVGNRLTWATIKNTPNDYFIIQKSVDGSSFYEIGRLQATKSGGAVKTQVFYDEKSTGGYYRIKQVGADGQFTYSKTIFLDSDAIDAADVYIFPNPNAGTFIVSGLLDAPSAKVEIFDLNGKAVFFNTDGVDELQLKISGLSKGIYLVKISTEYFVDTKKIVVY